MDNYLIIRVASWEGKVIQSLLTPDNSITEGNELELIVNQLKEFLEKNEKERKKDLYCSCTIEAVIAGEKIIPETTVKIPATLEEELRKIIFEIQEFYEQQTEKGGSYFKGNVYQVINHA